jgi:hypothetical protein
MAAATKLSSMPLRKLPKCDMRVEGRREYHPHIKQSRTAFPGSADQELSE